MVWAAERPAVSSAAVAALCVGGAYVGFTLAQRMFGKVITITVPATTANLACGFDAFGAAFELRMVMRVSPAKTLQFEYIGEGAEKVARDESNLIWRSAQACMRQCAPGKTLPPLKIEISNPVPFGRGLGSSATAIIAGEISRFPPSCHPQFFTARPLAPPSRPPAQPPSSPRPAAVRPSQPHGRTSNYLVIRTRCSPRGCGRPGRAESTC